MRHALPRIAPCATGGRHWHSRSLWIAAAVLIVLIALGGAAYLSGVLPLQQPDLIAPLAPRCGPRGGLCAILPEGGKIEVRFDPHPLPVARPFQVQVDATDLATQRVDIEFNGVDMDMGPNRLTLPATGNGMYEATATLPACISGSMKWRAILTIHTRTRRILIPYEFHTGGDETSGAGNAPTGNAPI